MAIDVTLRDIQSGFLTATAFTENNTLIEQALQKAINREGGANNEMLADLDMGLNWINNLKSAYQDHQAVPYGQMQRTIQSSSNQVVSTAELEKHVATEGQTVIALTVIEYLVGTNALLVFKDGVYQLASEDYLETDGTTITFTTPLTAGNEVVIMGARFNAEVYVTESQGYSAAAAASASDAETFASDAASSSNDAQAAQAAAEAAAGYKLGVNTQVGTSYTLVASDEGDLVRMTNAGANTVTVPANATVPFEIGTIVNIRQSGAGTTTVSPAAGVTINAPLDEFATDGEEFGVAIVKVGLDEWDLVKSYAGVRNTEFEASISGANFSEGSQKLPSGLIFKWGGLSASSGTVTFAEAFPTAILNIQITANRNTGIATAGQYHTASLSGFAYVVDTTGGDGSWFAIGV